MLAYLKSSAIEHFRAKAASLGGNPDGVEKLLGHLMTQSSHLTEALEYMSSNMPGMSPASRAESKNYIIDMLTSSMPERWEHAPGFETSAGPGESSSTSSSTSAGASGVSSTSQQQNAKKKEAKAASAQPPKKEAEKEPAKPPASAAPQAGAYIDMFKCFIYICIVCCLV